MGQDTAKITRYERLLLLLYYCVEWLSICVEWLSIFISVPLVYLQNCVLSFHKHGMQGKSLVTQQVTAEVADGSKVFHLLGSHG